VDTMMTTRWFGFHAVHNKWCDGGDGFRSRGWADRYASVERHRGNSHSLFMLCPPVKEVHFAN